jgi:Tudor domain
LRDFLVIYKSINVYGNRVKSKDAGIPLSKDEMCLAYVNDRWHRAIVEQTFGDAKPLCCLIDLLKLTKVKISNIIPIPDVFKRPPPFVELCKVDGFGQDSSDEMKATVSRIIRENHLLHVDEIVEKEGPLKTKEVVLRIDDILKHSKSV